MSTPDCTSAVGQFVTENHRPYTPTKGSTPADCSSSQYTRGAVSVLKAGSHDPATEETGSDRPAAPFSPNPRITIPPHLQHLFRGGDALLESAIAVAEVHVLHATDEADREFAMRELGTLRAQRESY